MTLEDRCPPSTAGLCQRSRARLGTSTGLGQGSALHPALPRLLLPFRSVLHTALHLGGIPRAAVTKDHKIDGLIYSPIKVLEDRMPKSRCWQDCAALKVKGLKEEGPASSMLTWLLAIPGVDCSARALLQPLSPSSHNCLLPVGLSVSSLCRSTVCAWVRICCVPL